jgi:hypothetical protein
LIPAEPDRRRALLKLQRDGASAWRLFDKASGAAVGGIRYVHDADGNHYQPWLLVDGVAVDLDERLPQLAMAARVIEARIKPAGSPFRP